MRVLMVLSVMAIVFGSTACEAGMSTGPHKVAAATPTARHANVGHHRGGGRVRHARGIGGPIAAVSRPIAAVGGAIGHTIGGIFR
jgi:hypothetical protein